ncbi:hypothetical protein J2W51_002307 [Tardiphaga robiniae]|uniref:hypothetical protein n=1 Tax=Tardiphaga robiniae TaxID=943830 RepID=UPI00285AA47D|nr:hypothetical protein [Tardiphaga robiniae]MDR6659737.1 hypothetical protein [Tardiphaga robiniae]
MFGFFRCGHIRDAHNSRPHMGYFTCRTCWNAWKRQRYRRLRDEGASREEIYYERSLNAQELSTLLAGLGRGLSLAKITECRTGCPHGPLYQRFRIWAESNATKARMVYRLSRMNVEKRKRVAFEKHLLQLDAVVCHPTPPAEVDLPRILKALPQRAPAGEAHDEVVQSLVMDLMEGRCSYETLAQRAEYQVGRYFDQYADRFGAESLDAGFSAEGNQTLGDRITRGLWD